MPFPDTTNIYRPVYAEEKQLSWVRGPNTNKHLSAIERERALLTMNVYHVATCIFRLLSPED